MPITSKYLFVASMDVDPDKEDLFNEVYDTEHIPNLLKVPGVYAVTRIKANPSREYRRCRAAGHHGHSAISEIEGPCWSAQRGLRPSNWVAGPASPALHQSAARALSGLLAGGRAPAACTLP